MRRDVASDWERPLAREVVSLSAASFGVRRENSEVVDWRAEEVSIVSSHCWNIGRERERKYCVYMQAGEDVMGTGRCHVP